MPSSMLTFDSCLQIPSQNFATCLLTLHDKIKPNGYAEEQAEMDLNSTNGNSRWNKTQQTVDCSTPLCIRR